MKENKLQEKLKPREKKKAEYDLIQLFTKGTVRKKELEIIFVNSSAQSFFMKAEAYIDLLENIEIPRLVKKYNKTKKAAYLGGEVLGCVKEYPSYYEFKLAIGPQNQIIDEETKILEYHVYKIRKETVELYEDMIFQEEETNDLFLKYLKEADHNIQKRFDIAKNDPIDFKNCLT